MWSLGREIRVSMAEPPYPVEWIWVKKSPASSESRMYEDSPSWCYFSAVLCGVGEESRSSSRRIIIGPKIWWSRQLTGGHKTGPRHGHVCQEVSWVRWWYWWNIYEAGGIPTKSGCGCWRWTHCELVASMSGNWLPPECFSEVNSGRRTGMMHVMRKTVFILSWCGRLKFKPAK